MSHAVHTTRAFVLASTPVQDSDKLFWLLTEDVGLVFASAKSVREETSKLRYVLQDLAHVRASLVRGRGLWRITGASDGYAHALPAVRAAALGRMATLIRRLTPTEDAHAPLFAILSSAHAALANEANTVSCIEHLTVARIMYQLGYLSRVAQYEGVVDTTHMDNAILRTVASLERELVEHINAGLAESQL